MAEHSDLSVEVTASASAAPPVLDLAAFERAAALLKRDEHLDDSYEQWEKKTRMRGGGGGGGGGAAGAPRRRQITTGQAATGWKESRRLGLHNLQVPFRALTEMRLKEVKQT